MCFFTFMSSFSSLFFYSFFVFLSYHFFHFLPFYFPLIFLVLYFLFFFSSSFVYFFAVSVPPLSSNAHWMEKTPQPLRAEMKAEERFSGRVKLIRADRSTGLSASWFLEQLATKFLPPEPNANGLAFRSLSLSSQLICFSLSHTLTNPLSLFFLSFFL